MAVNHLWRWHFNQPLVASTHDFGRNGKRPTHPALLDWLAAELVGRGWSMKAMHRLIVTSDAYRMASHSSDPEDPNQALDPENRGYWRFTPARMESEVVRDSLLQVAGALDPAVGGPDIDFNQGFTSRRRSLYLTHHGEGRMPFLELFDAPDACEAYTRTVSVIPQQALALTNNELARELSRKLARRLWDEATESTGQTVKHCGSCHKPFPPLRRGGRGGGPGHGSRRVFPWSSLLRSSLAILDGTQTQRGKIRPPPVPIAPIPPPLTPPSQGGESSALQSGWTCSLDEIELSQALPRLPGRKTSNAAFIAAAFEQVLNRAASPSELDLSLAFLQKQEQLLTGLGAEATSRARENLVHALFSHNDFLTVH